jgi:membrane protein GlpM
MDYIIKGGLGAIVVLLIAFLSKSKYVYLAGLAPLFPTFALFAHLLSFQSGGASALKEVAYFGLLSIIPYAAYLLAIIFLIDRTELSRAITISLLIWCLSSAAIVYSWDGLGLKSIVMGKS